MERGIALYTIELDKCLTGVYTNDGADGIISNEIAIKHTDFGDDDLTGVYNCYYFENGKPNGFEAELTIDIDGKSKTKRMYKFNWERNGKRIFEGIGFKMNNKQVAVNYTAI